MRGAAAVWYLAADKVEAEAADAFEDVRGCGGDSEAGGGARVQRP